MKGHIGREVKRMIQGIQHLWSISTAMFKVITATKTLGLSKLINIMPIFVGPNYMEELDFLTLSSLSELIAAMGYSVRRLLRSERELRVSVTPSKTPALNFWMMLRSRLSAVSESRFRNVPGSTFLWRFPY